MSVYKYLLEDFITQERDREAPLMHVSVQLLTSSSIASHLLLKTDFFKDLLSIFSKLLFSQTSVSEIDFDEPLGAMSLPIDVDTAVFKSKRYFHVCEDMQHLLIAPGSAASAHRFVGDFSALLLLFHGMNPSTRVTAFHVEYESDGWVYAFNASLRLSRLARVFVCEAYASIDETTSQEALQHILQHIRRLKDYFPQQTSRRISCGTAQAQVLPYNVATQIISFHHPLHWFLGLVLGAATRNDTPLEEHFAGLINELDHDAILQVFDVPLRGQSVAMIAQTADIAHSCRALGASPCRTVDS